MITMESLMREIGRALRWVVNAAAAAVFIICLFSLDTAARELPYFAGAMLAGAWILIQVVRYDRRERLEAGR